MRDRLRALLLENIRREREGELVDKVLMKHSLAMLVDLGVEGTAVYEVRSLCPSVWLSLSGCLCLCMWVGQVGYGYGVVGGVKR